MHPLRPAAPLAVALIVVVVLTGALAACGEDGAVARDASDVGVGVDVPANPDPPPANFGPADHVSAAKYTRLVLEVDFVTGKGPNGAALSEVQAALDRMRGDGQLAKPDGVEFAIDDVIAAAPAGKVWTFAELEALGKGWRDRAVGADESAIHILYVDGGYQDDTPQGTVLGFAYGGNWLVMLKDNINAACEGSAVLNTPLFIGLRDKVCAHAEASVLLHELGHLFGLVDNGTPMVVDHEDPAHHGHDVDPDCLMYWAIQRSGAVDLVAQRFAAGTPTLGFCAPSLADLDAVANP